MKKDFFKDRMHLLVIMITLIVSICLLSTVAYALDSLDTETIIAVPSAEDAAESVRAVSYSIAPNHLFPFIYNGTSPSAWREIDTTGCVENLLYVHNSNTNTVIKITDCAVAAFTTTKDDLFYVTGDQKIIQTDYTGSFHTQLYQSAQGDISNLDYFNGSLNFIEGGMLVKVLNVSSQAAQTVFAHKDLSSVFFFDDDKFIWRNNDDQAFYYDITSKGTVAFSNESEVNSVIAPYITPILTDEEQAELMSTAMSENDITFPLPDYRAKMATFAQYNKDYPTALNYFRDGDKTKPGCNHVDNDDPNAVFDCRYYAGSRQCDGFARYAYETYIHRSNTTWGAPYFPSADRKDNEHNPATDDPEEFTESDLKDFFTKLTTGAFVRFGKIRNGTCQEQHSAVVSVVLDYGVWLYECNNDWQCGVFYTFYTFEEFATKYHCVRYYINHTFTRNPQLLSEERHTVYCVNCDGYTVPTHTGSKRHYAYDSEQHEIVFTCCSGRILEDHVFEGTWPECLECAYS